MTINGPSASVDYYQAPVLKAAETLPRSENV